MEGTAVTVTPAKPKRKAKGGYKPGRSYFDLIDLFPLVAIRSEAEYDRATAVAQSLFGREDLDEDQDRYLDALCDLVSAYEARAYDFDHRPTELAPLAILKHLMDANGMGPADLGRLIGSAPYASMILRGRRKISPANAKKLAARFRVDAGLFL